MYFLQISHGKLRIWYEIKMLQLNKILTITSLSFIAFTLQEYPLKKSVQVAPFWQGLGLHSSTCSSQ